MTVLNQEVSQEKYKELLDEFRSGSVNNHEAILKHLYRLLQNSLNMTAQAENTVQKQNREIELLQRLTHIDAGTGLYSRRGLEMMMNREIGLIRNEVAAPGCVAHIGILNIATLAKRYSAEAACEVELAIADMLKKQFRSFDVVARTGKGQFTVMLPQARKAQVREIHENIKQVLKSFSIEWRGRKLPAFLTIAVAKIDEDSSSPEIIQRVTERARDNDGFEIGKHQIH